MSGKLNILIMGASYGSLLGTKLALAGHDVTLVCLPAEAEAINRDGVRVRMPIKGRQGLIEIDTRQAPGKISALGPDAADPSAYDLIGLAMQEPQYRSAGVRELLDRVALSGKPTMSIMNMPPLPYLARIPGLDTAKLTACYTDAGVWRNFDSRLITLASPDPQAFRPPEEPPNVLQVALPTNFKVARFASDAHTAMLKQLDADIQAVRFADGDESIELPVKLKVHESIFVPLAKWAMLIAGNYRCVEKDGARSIREAVHSDLAASRVVYDWVKAACVKLGAAEDDLVPFDKYANAAQGLAKPSSAARALVAGAQNIERVDLLVKMIASMQGMSNPALDETVSLVDGWLQKNRAAAAA